MADPDWPAPPPPAAFPSDAAAEEAAPSEHPAEVAEILNALRHADNPDQAFALTLALHAALTLGRHATLGIQTRRARADRPGRGDARPHAAGPDVKAA